MRWHANRALNQFQSFSFEQGPIKLIERILYTHRRTVSGPTRELSPHVICHGLNFPLIFLFAVRSFAFLIDTLAKVSPAF